MKRFFYRILCGFFLGISALAPGFSGSLMAITMGIYQDLVKIISNPLKELRKNMGFFAPIAVGILISVVVFVLVFEALFQTHIRATLLLFVGLIAGNLPVILREVQKFKFQKRFLIGGFLTFAIALGINLIGLLFGQSAGGEVTGNALFIELAVSGFVAGAITLVPGMSISAILIMLGVYGHLMVMAGSLLRLDMTYLLPLLGVLLFALAGLILTSRGIKRLFERFPGIANSCVMGFMAGTMIGIIIESFHAQDPNFRWIFGALAVIAGLGVSYLFVILGKKVSKRADG